MKISSYKQQIEAALNLLEEDSTTREKFESIRTLIKGIDQRLDQQLATVSSLISDTEKLQQGKVIDLTIKYLPENTDREKKRKRVVLLLINSWKQLQGELVRVKGEIDQSSEDQTTLEQQASSVGKIVSFAKGPLGIITIAAVLIVGTLAVVNSLRDLPSDKDIASSPTPHDLIKVIIIDNKKIPLTELKIADGPECDGEHYHAKNENRAESLDGTLISDPNPYECGFGKVKEVEIVEVQ